MKMACQSRVVFIGHDNPLGLSPLIPYLENLSQDVPATQLEFKIVPDDLTLPELETLVGQYVEAGFTHIGLPVNTFLIDDFLRGDGLVNRSVAERWPNTLFMVQYYGLGEIPYENVYGFGDVNTLVEPSLVEYNLTNFAQNAGMVYVIYQGMGDEVTEWEAEFARQTLENLGFHAQFYEVGLNEDLLKEAVDDISMSLPPAPAQSAVIHIVNWFNAEEYTQAALNAGLFDFPEEQVIHSSFLDEYYPVNTTLPVRLHIGRIPLEGIPSQAAADIGIPINPAEYYSFPYLLSFLDAYLWAATCGDTYGINDKQLRFDKNNVRISYYLADLSIPPNSLSIDVGPLLFNPRWFNPDAEVVPE